MLRGCLLTVYKTTSPQTRELVREMMLCLTSKYYFDARLLLRLHTRDHCERDIET